MVLPELKGFVHHGVQFISDYLIIHANLDAKLTPKSGISGRLMRLMVCTMPPVRWFTSTSATRVINKKLRQDSDQQVGLTYRILSVASSS
jgi:hypothetical protein